MVREIWMKRLQSQEKQKFSLTRTPSSSVDEAECRSKKTRQPPRMLTYDNMGLLSYTLIGQVDVAVDCINFN